MSAVVSGLDDSGVIASYGQPGQGPLVLVLCGIHGNEAASVVAAQAVSDWLNLAKPTFVGHFVALAGNLAALRLGERCVQRDLNRAWTPEQVADVRARVARRDAPIDSEEREQRRLLAHFDALLEQAEGDVLALDLHSFSSSGAPFSVVPDAPLDIDLALDVGLTAILNLDKHIRGTILEHFTGLGCPVMGVEAGSHYHPRTAGFHESAILVALVARGLLEPADVPHFDARRADLKRASMGLTDVVDVVYRHAIGPDDAFVMRPGFRNLQPVYRGQPLADDARGVVVAPIAGWLLMPLYQGSGDDGFFIALSR